MKKILLNKYFLTFVGIVLFFAIWIIIYFVSGQNKFVFPSPKDTFEQMFNYLGQAYVYGYIGNSLKRMLIGFTISAVLAIAIGVIVGNYLKLKIVFNPTMIALKAVPTAALVFLFLKMAGFTDTPMFIVGIIVFPIVYEATVAGYSSTDPQMIMASKVDGANRIRSNVFVRFPLALPTIILGLISSFALSLKIEIMAEVIASTSKEPGLGRAIQFSYYNSSNGLVSTFAYSLIAIIVMLIVTMIFDLLKKLLKL